MIRIIIVGLLLIGSNKWNLVGQGVNLYSTSFEIPSAPKTINWLTTPLPRRTNFNGKLSITARIDATPTAWFNYQTESFNTCYNPAAARPYFAVANWGGRHIKRGESPDNFRWWSSDAILLTDGEFTISVPLISSAWTNVNGLHDINGFQWALSQAGEAGLTFGGGCFYGHGINVVDGSAQFTLLNFEIIP